MKQPTLDRRIDGFLGRKFREHRDLDRSVAEITRELEAGERATTILHWAEEPQARQLDRQFSYHHASHAGRIGSLQYAL